MPFIAVKNAAARGPSKGSAAAPTFRAAEAMMTSPELNNTGSAANGSNLDGMRRDNAASDGGSAEGRTDDVSFAKSIGVDQTSDKMKDAAQRGMSSAEDAMAQLQAKASELTSNLIDRVNIDELTQKLEEQVRDHPARTLLMAAGAGFLLGRAAKK
jgi:ElaB/YqjD/DUF883 family membrane-anchored ribosome-binding protein